MRSLSHYICALFIISVALFVTTSRYSVATVMTSLFPWLVYNATAT